MTFEEEFPEWSERRSIIKLINDKVAVGHADDIADTIMKLLNDRLDKQRVREAIEKMGLVIGEQGLIAKELCKEEFTVEEFNEALKNALKKELGL